MNGSDKRMVVYSRENVGCLLINRPAVKNALDMESRRELWGGLKEFEQDPSIRTVILYGADNTFCSGRDLKAAKAGEPMFRNRDEAIHSFPRSTITKPVIAAVEGYAYGGGFELALGCDLVVAARGAKFGLPEVSRNLVAIGGGLFRLAARVGNNRAMELALTGIAASAETLHTWGIVNYLCDNGDALDTAMNLAETIGKNGPSALRTTKEIIRRARSWSSDEDSYDAQYSIALEALSSADREEGVSAFLEKREPNWSDDGTVS